MDKYILNGKVPVPCSDVMEWGRCFENQDSRKVAQTTLGDVMVSTVFLGIDHSFGCGPPILFETMVFGGKLDQEQDRCSTWEQAEAMHKAMCERVRANEEHKP